MPLLLLGDEQESMIDRYLDRGEMFALIDASQITIAIAGILGYTVCAKTV